MRMTNEKVIAPELVELFHRLYAGAFAPIASLAAARHVLTFAEFAEEMADPRIEKHVFWDADGAPVALATYTRDLRAIPWISPAFYAARFPEAAARDAIVYMGYSLVHPAHQGKGVMRMLLEDTVATVRAVDGVGVFDACAYNDARQIGYLHKMIAQMGSIEPVDTQTYYACTFNAAATYRRADENSEVMA